MPHITVKLYPGKTEDQKRELAERLTTETMAVLGHKESSVSVSFEEVSREEWQERVYQPEIVEKASLLYKRPGYSM